MYEQQYIRHKIQACHDAVASSNRQSLSGLNVGVARKV